MTEGKSAGERLRELIEIVRGNDCCASVAEACGTSCNDNRNCCSCREVWLRKAADLAAQSAREQGREAFEKRLAQLEREKEVLDADGVPIEVGDEVWIAGAGEQKNPLKVEGFTHMVTVKYGDDFCKAVHFRADLLTHERPDSWEALEDDATRDPREYALRRGIKCGDAPSETMALDLVARAKRLAGVVE